MDDDEPAYIAVEIRRVAGIPEGTAWRRTLNKLGISREPKGRKYSWNEAAAIMEAWYCRIGKREVKLIRRAKQELRSSARPPGEQTPPGSASGSKTDAG